MKKKFLDYLYEKRFTIQVEIDRLVELGKMPKNADDNTPDCLMTELRTRISQIETVNHIIEEYLDKH